MGELMKRAVYIFVLAVFPVLAGTGGNEKLTVHLPRQVQIQGRTILLGQAVVMAGPQNALNTAMGIEMGTFTTPGQVIPLDRYTILSRLASAGIDASAVQLSGADCVKVSRQTVYLEGKRFTETAKAYLEKKLADSGAYKIEPVNQPQDIALNEPNAPLDLRAQEGRCKNPGAAQVTVGVWQNGKEVARQSLSFAVRYKVKQAVAAEDIRAGTAIGQEQVRIEEVESNRPQEQWQSPLGLTAKRTINKNAIIRPEWAGRAEQAVMVKSRQQVMLKIDTGQMFVTAAGEAMDDGKTGDVIRVKRGTRPNERIVLGTILADGAVKPLM